MYTDVPEHPIIDMGGIPAILGDRVVLVVVDKRPDLLRFGEIVGFHHDTSAHYTSYHSSKAVIQVDAHTTVLRNSKEFFVCKE